MVTDQIADLLTRVRNAGMAQHPSVSIPHSRFKLAIVNLLKDEGFIDTFEEGQDSNEKPEIRVFLKYDDNGKAAIRQIKRVSKPGKRTYVASGDIPWCKGGLGLYVVSTSKGLLSDREARKQGVGGELICSVF